MIRFSPAAAVIAALVVLSALPASAKDLHSRRPKSVLHYEEIPAIAESASDARPGAVQVTFHAFGRRFDLFLEKNPLFGAAAEDVWVGPRGSRGKGPAHRRQKPEALVYKGTVFGDPGSWVRVSLRGGVLDGVIGSEGELYFIEPAARFFRAPTDIPMVAYRLSDTTSDLGPGSCALDDPLVAERLAEPAGAQESGAGDAQQLHSEFQTLAAGSLKQIDLAMVADYEYYLEHGLASAADMQSLVNQVDGIFQAELGLTLRITRTVVHTSAQDPFSSTTDPAALLNEFASYKGSTSSPIYGTDLAQLFTNRDLAGSTVGIAWVATLCDGAYGTSLAQDFTSTSKSLTILSAHEMGHNLAARHDSQSGSPCQSTPFGYIMYPSVSTSLNLQFSDCSKSSIAPEVAAASCLTEVTGTPSCSYALSPASASVASGGGGGSVAVSAGSACSWSAASSASWLTVTSGASGTGNGTVVYSAAANPGPGSRSATLTIAGQSFTVSQAAPASQTQAITVTTPNGGETWPIGSVRTITWASSGVTGRVRIDVSRNGGATWAKLWDNSVNDGKQNWTVTGPATTAARIRVRSVSQPAIEDISNASFVIR